MHFHIKTDIILQQRVIIWLVSTHFNRSNVLKIRPVIESEKLLVHGLMIESMVKLWLNRRRHKYIINIYLNLNFFKYKYIIKNNI